MSYRKITVDGKEYEYVVGKTHTKIKGIGLWKNEDIGHMAYISDEECECCGEPMASLYPSRYPRQAGLAVTPHDIMRKIRIPTAEDAFKALKGVS